MINLILENSDWEIYQNPKISSDTLILENSDTHNQRKRMPTESRQAGFLGFGRSGLDQQEN